MGCIFFHVTHNCNRGDACRFSHAAISKAELKSLRRIHKEIEMDKRSVGMNRTSD